MNGRVRGLASSFWRAFVSRVARAYVAGLHLEAAIRTCVALSARGVASTICYWNADSESPHQVVEAYLAALEAISRADLDCYLSVKALPLGFQPALVDEIVERAQARGVRVHFDSLGPESANPTFALATRARATYRWLGCTLPGRWRRSVQDARWACEADVCVRVVKGQWPETEASAADGRAGFLDVIDQLAGRARHVAVATHDAALAEEALRRLRVAGTPCELELLFGLPLHRPVAVARAARVPVRLYVPYGLAWLPYSFSQLRQHPHMLRWILRDLLLGRFLCPPRGFLPRWSIDPPTHCGCSLSRSRTHHLG